MIQAHIVQRGSHGGDGVARPDSMGKTEDGHIVVTSGIAFFSGCHFQCLRIFGISILCCCKIVVFGNQRLNKFFRFSWIVVYIRIGVQLNVPWYCFGGIFVVAGFFVVALRSVHWLGGIRLCAPWCLQYNGGTSSPFVTRRIFFFLNQNCMRMHMR